MIVGGGNAAIDAARVARRLGADVTISYRRTRFDMPAIPGEIAAAEAEGVIIELQSLPKSIAAVAAENGGGLGVTMLKTEPGEPDASGRRQPVPVAGSESTRSR